jgi:hypothetical protein
MILSYPGDRSPRIKSGCLTGEHLLLILPIAHKYCMDKIEADIIEVLKKTSTYNGFVDLIVASRIVGSDELYQDGIQRLISSKSSPELEQSKRMGAEVTHIVMTAVIDRLKSTRAAEVQSARSEINNAVSRITSKLDSAIVTFTAGATASASVRSGRHCQFCQRLNNWN